MDETKIEETEKQENECPNKKEDCKKEGKGKCKELEAIIEKLTKDLEQEKKTATSYLSTASYYKTQADETKKDFERFKERNKNIETEAKTKAAESVAKQILPILDNFDQALAKVDPEIMKGFAMIYSSLKDVITDLGVVEINPKDEELNPELHSCISTEPTDDENADGKIAAIYQKGYMFAESKKVIRPATVSVYKLNK
ncbi:MAG: nucleotide exchange factor GrpE [Clostridia bacterium]|nr:nucleotide exchange factor GrpE [Clostridia bacterium]